MWVGSRHFSAHNPTLPSDLTYVKSQPLHRSARPDMLCTRGSPLSLSHLIPHSPTLCSSSTACLHSKHSPASRHLLWLIPQSGTLFPRCLHGFLLNLFQVFAQMSPYQWGFSYHPIQISTPNHTSTPIPFIPLSSSLQHSFLPPDIAYTSMYSLKEQGPCLFS